MSGVVDTAEKITSIVREHRRNEVIEPDHSPGGSLARTRVKCDGRDCDFYGVYPTWFKACEAHEAHLTEKIIDLIAVERSAALREAAYHYGVIWGSGVTTEENVSIVLNHWADHGIGVHPLAVQPPKPPKRFDTYRHPDGRECLFMTGWSWTAFAGDEQSAVRVTCDRTHPPQEGTS